MDPLRYLRPATVASWFRQSSLSEPNQDTIAALGGERVISGERIDVDSSLRIADVFTAVKIVASTIGTLPFRVYRSLPNGNVEEAPTHRAAPMLGYRPNPIMPAHLFWSTVAAHLLLWGNAYIEKLRDENGLVAELWLIHPSFVTVEYEPTLRSKRFVIEGNGQKAVYGDDRVLHMFGFTTNGLFGMSPIQQCRQSLGTAKARERFEAEVYAQKPFLSGVITHPTTIRDNGKRIRESWQAIHGGGDRTAVAEPSGRHSVAVLEEGAMFNPLSAPLEDMQFVEAQQMSKRTIASMYGLPPAYLGGATGDSLTYQTVESNQIQLARMAISPVTTNIQKFLSFDPGIFPFSSWYGEFVLEGLLRADSTARSTYYKSMFEIVDADGRRALDVNEIRALENRSPASADPATVQAREAMAQALNGGGDDDEE
jgi:HK97 family phage portal protein